MFWASTDTRGKELHQLWISNSRVFSMMIMQLKMKFQTKLRRCDDQFTITKYLSTFRKNFKIRSVRGTDYRAD